MNTNPDKQSLLLWLEDELDAGEQARIDAWAIDQPEWLAKRAEARLWKQSLRAAVPASVEPPYPEFFQAKLERALREESYHNEQAREHKSEDVRGTTPSASWWKKAWMPASVAAALALGFLAAEMRTEAKPEQTLVIYTPEEGVKAEFFETSPAEGTVIVLNGVAAIPDDFEVPDTASVMPSGIDGSRGDGEAKPTATVLTP